MAHRGRSGAGGGHRSASRRWAAQARRFPRSARVNEILREVLADELEKLEDLDERLGFLTVTAVDCDPDLRHALVMLSSLDDEGRRALEGARVRLQAAISDQVRLKRTPQLRFAADPAVAEGQRIEDIIRSLADDPRSPGDGSTDGR